MRERIEAGYVAYKPTTIERVWRALGFSYHLGDEPEGVDGLEGWMCTETRLHFGIADRLRLLVTGRLHITLVQHLPVRCDWAKNRLDWQIKYPGEQ